MQDPGDGSVHQAHNITVLHYAGDMKFSYEEDAYNPAAFGPMIEAWTEASSPTAAPTAVTDEARAVSVNAESDRSLPSMTDGAGACLPRRSSPPRTGKLATVRADGRPHLAPVWYDVDDDGSVVFNTGESTVKGRNLTRDPRASLCVDDERPPFSFVVLEGVVELSDDLERGAPLGRPGSAGVTWVPIGPRSTARATASLARCSCACARRTSSRPSIWPTDRRAGRHGGTPRIRWRRRRRRPRRPACPTPG